ncbi:iron-siderophore ABC transporter substrate-binding protein [Nocardiopsis sp. EMB25]|uniref:iron-siderophore ABC transporter substrate-binding protein n=1 Tax=Nocardiopsis sp. EMB25 TaxID=2835867 RepID=UPI002284ED41|nr:iron-siderophore ABC transporter substrate-binding protein [Nocardiopsis sp. EMB25]MCY9787181.1 iron-siderophore ABC transporter substrate-binding protein [Nocardiopsis sp. EMB25]
MPAVRLPRPARYAAAGLALTAFLTACSGGDTEDAATGGDGGGDGAFPVTIDSALGETVIPEQPERVVTWGWSAQDVVLALDVMPVAMPRNDYGGDENGIFPWDAERIAELGGEAPTILTGAHADAPPLEEIVEARPDVILAPNSGITQEDFDRLSEIAPTVAYPDQPWATTWQEQVDIVGRALGMEEEADDLLAQTQEQVGALAAEHPVLEGTTFFYAAANEADVLNVYREYDPRVEMLTDLGMEPGASVTELDADPDDSFFFQVSYENLQEIETDVLVMYFADEAALEEFTSDPLVAAMPAVQEGRFAPIVGEDFVMASSAPTVLSIPWMLDRYVPELAAAAENVE